MNSLLDLFIGFGIITYAIYIFKKHEAELGFGRPAFITIKIRERLLVTILTISFMLGGVLWLLNFILPILNIRSDYMPWLPICGFSSLIAGIVFTTILQIAIYSGKWLGKQQENDKSDNR